MKYIAKWLFFFLSITIPAVLLSEINFERSFSPEEYDKLKDQVEIISWLFAGVMAIVAFLSLFIGLLYENKLIAASNTRRQLYHPYNLSLTEIRNNLFLYDNNVSGSKFMKIIYLSFVLVSMLTIFVWGTAVGFYTKFKFSYEIKFTIESSLIFGIYAFYFLICFFLFCLTFILNQLKNNKDPLGNGYLPTTKELCNVDHLINIDCDLDEVILKLGPSLEFFKNPPSDKPTYEMNFHLPVKLSNYRFVIKMYDKDRKPLIKCFGVLKNITHIGEKANFHLSSNFPKYVYEALKDNSTGELKLYDSEYNIVSRISLKLNDITNEGFRLDPGRIIYQRDNIELDNGLIRNVTVNKIEFIIER